MVRAGGTLALLGIFNDPVTINLTDDVVFKCVDIKGIYGRKVWDTWNITNGLLRAGVLDLDTIITHRFKFEDILQGFEAMASGNSGKVVLTF
jgi:threonine 3-dehydrogenase